LSLFVKAKKQHNLAVCQRYTTNVPPAIEGFGECCKLPQQDLWL